MKVSLNWIKEYAKIGANTDEIVRHIGSQLGEVEKVIDYGTAYQGVVVVKIVDCQPHPDADKLQVCLVDDGGITPGVDRNNDGMVQVVCGALNAKAGLLTAWIPPGYNVPQSVFDGEPFKLEARKLRGEISYGMLASEAELNLSLDHDGIVDLGSDEHSFEPGQLLANELGLNDFIIDIENKMFTRRPDCFGVLGVAREVAAIFGTKISEPEWYKSEYQVSGPEDKNLNIDISVPDLVARFSAQVITGIKVGPSSLKMKVELRKHGLKPINNVVDAGNYFAWLTGQPTHIFDLDKLKALSATDQAVLQARLATKGEKLSLINGKEIDLVEEDIVIATDKNVVGLAGIMGGSSTQVDSATQNIVIEAANFNMYSIRRSSMRHGLFTDAVTRFTKKQSSRQTWAGIAPLMDGILEVAGGAAANFMHDLYPSVPAESRVCVSVDFINSRLGTSLAESVIKEMLDASGFSIDGSGTLEITAPFWRTDIEIPEDIVEEVGRLYGYDNIDLKLPMVAASPAKRNQRLDFKLRVSNVLAATGANETLTYSFVDAMLHEACGQNPDNSYKIVNALSPTLHYYRQSIVPSLLNLVHTNIRAGYDEFALFEMGPFHTKLHATDDTGLPEELQSLGFVYAASKKLSQPAYFYSQNYLDALLTSLRIEYELIPIPKDFTAQVANAYNLDRSALIKSSEEIVGILGEMSAKATKTLKLPDNCAAFELSLDSLMAKSTFARYSNVGTIQTIQQDLTINASKGQSFGTINTKLKQALADQGLDCSQELLDIYDAEATTNYTFSITVYPKAESVKSADINAKLAAATQVILSA